MLKLLHGIGSRFGRECNNGGQGCRTRVVVAGLFYRTVGGLRWCAVVCAGSQRIQAVYPKTTETNIQSNSYHSRLDLLQPNSYVWYQKNIFQYFSKVYWVEYTASTKGAGNAILQYTFNGYVRATVESIFSVYQNLLPKISRGEI